MLFILLLNVFCFTQAFNYTNFNNNATIFYPCLNDADCLALFENTFCISNQCLCQELENCMEIKSTTKRVKKIGEICNDLQECVVNNSICFNNTCQCKDGFVASSGKHECLKLSKGIHSYCSEDVQCRKINGACANNVCICPNGFLEIHSFCVKNLGIGDACKSNKECTHIANSNCVGEKCKCFIGHIPYSKYQCLKQAEFLNSACIKHIQCTSTLGEGSQCINNTCKCKDIFHYKKSINACVLDLFLGEPCGKHEDCHQPGNDPSRLVCSFGECKCKYPYFEENNYCLNGSSRDLSPYLFVIVSSLFLHVYQIVF